MCPHRTDWFWRISAAGHAYLSASYGRLPAGANKTSASAGVNSGGAMTVAGSITSLSMCASGFACAEAGVGLMRR